MLRNHLLTLADYHVWAFDALFEALEPLDDTQYRADADLFFGSVHGTLNHLLLGDRVWYGRFAGEPYAVGGLDEELEPDRARLEAALRQQAARWRPWLESRSEASLEGTLDYRNLSGAAFSDPIALTAAHVFNHGTHHRGQISAALPRFGAPTPVMDLIYYLRGRDA